MIFLKYSLWPWLVLGVVVVSVALLWSEQRFFKWVQQHWFFRRRLLHVISSLALLVGFTLLAVVLLDPRSGEIKIKGKTTRI